MAKVQLNKELKDVEVGPIQAFLESLTGEFPRITAPRIPQPRGFSFYRPQSFTFKNTPAEKKQASNEWLSFKPSLFWGEFLVLNFLRSQGR
jgi:hypothetical protein